jgi:predicted RecB family nuclease
MNNHLPPRNPTESYALRLLNGIQSRTIKDMRQKGIRTLNQLVKMEPDDLKQFYGIKSKAHRLHAQARAWVGQEPIRCGEIPEVCQREAWYFDIETVVGGPDEGQIWSIGWSQQNRNTHAVMIDPQMHTPRQRLTHGHQIHYAPDFRAGWEKFAAVVSQDDGPLFHWSGYDASNMRTFVPDIYEQLKPRLFDLSRIFSQTVQIPRKGVSLKVVAPYLGFKWSAYDNWYLAWSDYKDWLGSRDDIKLTQLSHYQADDVLAMIVIRDWLINLQ